MNKTTSIKKISLAIGVSALILAASAQAESQYIKDVWNVGLYTQADSSSPSLGLISSGTKLEVLTQEGGYTQVKTSTGETGWTKTTYLVSQPTNDIKLKMAQRKIQILNEKIESLSADNVGVKLSAELEVAQANNKKLHEEYTQQKQQIDTLQAQINPVSSAARTEQFVRLLIIALVTLICGFIMGKRMTEAKVKARFNGMKVW